MLKFKNKVLIIIFLSMALFVTSLVESGYSFWEDTTDSTVETLPIGTWTFVPPTIGLDFANALSNYIDNELSLDPNSIYQYIYSQTNMPSNTTVTINNIDVFGYEWNFSGVVENSLYPTLGYPVLIDRSVDEFGNPIHDIAPTYSTTPLYPEYSYFVAYDANNLNTNNLYSLRLNYNSEMTSSTALGLVTNISFYAAVGLSDLDDAVAIRDDEKIDVEVSIDGIKWTRISVNNFPPQVGSEDELFNLYSYDVPKRLLGNNLFVRISFDGSTISSAGVDSYSRLIIDDLIITTN